MNDSELIDLFRRGRDGEPWAEPLPDPAAIWRRARTAELLGEALASQERSVRPLRAARGLAAAVAFLAAELGVAAGCVKLPAALTGSLATLDLPLGAATLLALAVVPMAALLALFWNARTTC
jgi:hypothetical protein